MSLRVLVIGADGAIGSSLTRELELRGHKVIGTTRRADHADDRLFLDLSSDDLVEFPRVDVAVICAAMSRFEECREQPILARLVNVTRPTAIAARLLAGGARVVQLSTSAVFDCLKPYRKAEDPRGPRSAYGRLKAEAEVRLLELGSGVSVVRLTKVIQSGNGILAYWADALARGDAVQAVKDHSFCPLPLDVVATNLASIIESDPDGIFQLSGAGDITYSDAALAIAELLQVPTSLVETVSPAASGIPDEETTLYTSLDTSRISALVGFVPPPPVDVLRNIYLAGHSRLRSRH